MAATMSTGSNGRHSALRDRVRHWADRLDVSPRVLRIQRMTRKWGSCSSHGTITLAEDLADQEEEFQDFVIAHELLHLRFQDHGRLFKALMSIHVPDWRRQDVARRKGCTLR
jgi:predicted metal-dependent hydrolase